MADTRLSSPVDSGLITTVPNTPSTSTASISISTPSQSTLSSTSGHVVPTNIRPFQRIQHLRPLDLRLLFSFRPGRQHHHRLQRPRNRVLLHHLRRRLRFPPVNVPTPLRTRSPLRPLLCRLPDILNRIPTRPCLCHHYNKQCHNTARTTVTDNAISADREVRGTPAGCARVHRV